MDPIRVGVIGGSGIYGLEGLSDLEEVNLETPFGSPSDTYFLGTLEEQRVAFLPRHGRGHRISPSELNNRANIWGFKRLGVEYLISLSACGSLDEGVAPGDFVVPDQLFDRTCLRPNTFFGEGLVVHISVADPFCAYLSGVLVRAAATTGKKVHQGGTFVTIEGPRFSTKAESRAYRQLGFTIVGMTAAPEAFLAREAEMSYATVAHVTDYDVWHESAEPVTVETVVRTLLDNAAAAKQAVRQSLLELKNAPLTPYRDSLRDAIMTSKTAIPLATRAKLDLLVGRYLK